jgi:hypothetical protein
MDNIYQVTIHGRLMQSRDLRSLLARAVVEKRNMDRRMQFVLRLPVSRMIDIRHQFQQVAG